MTPLDQITGLSDQARDIADRVEHFVRNTVIPMEKDARQDGHGPSDELVDEIRDLARDQGLLTPHIKDDGTPFTHRETTAILIRSGLSTLGMLGLNTSAPTRATSTCCTRSARLNSKSGSSSQWWTGAHALPSS